jgi:hypothetical protein
MCKVQNVGLRYIKIFNPRIVRHMKSRHMEGLDHPLTLEEILDETNQLDVTGKTKQWLLTEALG